MTTIPPHPARRSSRPLDPAILAHHVEGYGVEPAPLGALLDRRPTLLVFLRHFG